MNNQTKERTKGGQKNTDVKGKLRNSGHRLWSKEDTSQVLDELCEEGDGSFPWRTKSFKTQRNWRKATEINLNMVKDTSQRKTRVIQEERSQISEVAVILKD